MRRFLLALAVAAAAGGGVLLAGAGHGLTRSHTVVDGVPLDEVHPSGLAATEVTRYAAAHSEVAATVAISLPSSSVAQTARPAHLLLLYGSLEFPASTPPPPTPPTAAPSALTGSPLPCAGSPAPPSSF